MWTVVVLVRHLYMARVRRMELAEGIMVISTARRADGPRAWQTVPVAFPSVDRYEDDEEPIYAESITAIVRMTWNGPPSVDRWPVIYVHLTYAYPIEEWERRA